MRKKSCASSFYCIYCWFNPLKMLIKIKEPMLTAFVTRSSATALPISLRVAKLSGLVEEYE